MSFSASIGSFSRVLSYVPVPTVTQAATLGTVASISLIMTALFEKTELSKKISETFENVLVLLLGYSVPLTFAAAAQKKSPLLSRIALLQTSFFALKFYVKYRNLKKLQDNLVCGALIGGITINVIATSVLLYQQHSLPTAIHWLGSWVFPAMIARKTLSE